MVNLPSAEELGKLYDDAEAKHVERGVKGEKASVVRDVVRRIVEIKRQKGVKELSQASLRIAVIDALSSRDEAGASKKDYKLDQSHFAGIIANTYETKNDPTTKALVVLIDVEKTPKEKKPRTKKAPKAEAPGQ